MSDWADPIGALRHSHDRLAALVGPLDAEAVREPSYASEWSVAQVLSHLGSGAEIFELFLDAGLGSGEAPPPSAFGPIWDSWNSRPPEAQAADAIRADEQLVTRMESLDEAQRTSFALSMFGTDLDAAGLARLRLGEHALHTWDVAVALEPDATVAPDAVALLVDDLGRMAARAAKSDGEPVHLRVRTSDPARDLLLVVSDTSRIAPWDGSTVEGELSLPAEAFVRLVGGRLDADHTPGTVRADGVELGRLRRLFPGF